MVPPVVISSVPLAPSPLTEALALAALVFTVSYQRPKVPTLLELAESANLRFPVLAFLSRELAVWARRLRSRIWIGRRRTFVDWRRGVRTARWCGVCWA